jgi:hypothetical protein
MSTKVQARAKKAGVSVRFTTDNKINALEWAHVIAGLGQAIIAKNPQQHYTATDQMQYAAQALVQEYNLGPVQYSQLQIIVGQMMSSIEHRYGIKFATGAGAFLEDTETMMTQAGVPQHVQVEFGLCEMVLGMLVEINAKMCVA